MKMQFVVGEVVDYFNQRVLLKVGVETENIEHKHLSNRSILIEGASITYLLTAHYYRTSKQMGFRISRLPSNP